MKNFKVLFLHTDTTIREVLIVAFNQERAILRFYCEWGHEMCIIYIEQTTEKQIVVNKIKLVETDILECGTKVFRSQMKSGKCYADFIMGSDMVMKLWGYIFNQGFDFYPYNGEYEIIENKSFSFV